MKNIFKSIMMVLSGAMLFASCLKEAAPLASEISVNKQEVTFTGYSGSSAHVQKVEVTSNGDWFVICNEDWVTVNPSFGSAGMTKVEITVTDNVDSYNELNGPRSAVVNFCYGETNVAPLTVTQTGESGLDASRTYSLIKNQEDIVAGSYLIVFKNANQYFALEPLTASKTYGYLNAIEVTPEDDVITMSNAAYAFTLEEDEAGYHIIMSDNRYMFMTGAYNSFNVSAAKADSNPWTFTLNEDGTVKIAAVTYNNYVQYSTGYSSAGAYTSPQDGGLLPYLYKDAKAKSEEVLVVKDVTVPAFATSAKIKVQSNRSWSVRNHDEWIKSFTKKGKNDGEIEVTFDEYTSTTEERTATFQVIGEETNFTITFTQSKVAPTMTVEEFLADAVAKGDYAILTGSIENIKKADYGNFDLQDATGTVYIYGLYDVNGAKVFTDLGLKEGDIVTLYGPKDVYNNNPQVKSAIYVSHESSKIRRKLAFSAETAEAKLGNPFTAPTLSGDATDVEYTSSDVEVATVDAATGEVTLLAEGTTTITANGPETETHLAGTASYTLTVTAKTPRALAFSAAAAEATLGEEFTAPTLNGETAGVVYSSSDEEVATVDPATGAVTLVAAGETTITATAEADENFLAGTASYTLTVTEVFTAGKYWIVGTKNNVTSAMKPLAADKTYGYTSSEALVNNASYLDNVFTFTAVEGGYTISDQLGRYYYNTSEYKSFNLDTQGTLPACVWTVTKGDDNTYTIVNAESGKQILYADGTYTSFGVYGEKDTNTAVPITLIDASAATARPMLNLVNSSAAVDAEVTTYTIEVQSNMNWTATASTGVTLSPTSGNGNASVVMTFAANTSNTALTYTVTFTAGDLTETFTLTHKGVPAADSNPRWVKVTAEQEDWSGRYLIVFGTKAHATLASGAKDLNSTVDVSIVGDEIADNSSLNQAVMTVTKNDAAYNMKFADGKYFGMQHNGCKLMTSAFALGFAYTTSGVKISGSATNSGVTSTYYLYKNASAATVYYRCYVDKTGQSGYTLPTLYKYTE